MPHIHELFDFTVSGYVLHPTEPKILLLKHLKLGKWLQPGGHIELHEDPLQALHHELEEETGLRPPDYEIVEPADQPQVNYKNEKTLPLPFHLNRHLFKEDGVHEHIDMGFLIKAKTDKLTKDPAGASGIGWYNIREVRAKHAAGEMFDPTLEICEWIFARKL